MSLFLLLHVVLWTLVPAFMYHNPPRDSLEGLAWGHMWLTGYEKHPFLAPWLTALFTDLFGVVGWPIYLLSQLSVALCLLVVYQVATAMVAPASALLAVMLLDGVYYYSVGAIPFNPNVAMLPTWTLAIWAFREALVQPDGWRWSRAGGLAGLAALAKYESAVLFLVMLAALALLPEGRRAVRGRAFWLGIAATFLVVSPNLLWLARHDFAPFHYAMSNLALEDNLYTEPVTPSGSGLYPPLLFLLEQLGALLPLVLLYLPFMSWRNRDFSLRSFDRRFVMLMAVGPLVVTVLFAAAFGATLIARWGFPFFSMAGLALVLVFPPTLDAQSWRRFLAGLVAITLVEVGGSYWVIFVRPLHTGIAPYSIAYPGRSMSERVVAYWHGRFAAPLCYVAGDRWVVSTVVAFAPEKPTPYFEASLHMSPWLNEADLKRRGGVFVEPAERTALIAAIRRRYPALLDETVMSFAQHTAAAVPPVRLWVAILPPSPDNVEGALAP